MKFNGIGPQIVMLAIFALVLCMLPKIAEKQHSVNQSNGSKVVNSTK